MRAESLHPLHYAGPPARARSSSAPRTRRPISIWQILLCGYLTFGRGFAYLGVPPLFIGEVFIASSIVKNRRNWILGFFDDLCHLRLMPVSVAIVISWGLFEVFRSLMMPRPVAETLRTFAFNYYPICLIIGVAIGRGVELKTFLNFWKFFSVFYVIYSFGYLAVGDDFPLMAPWRPEVPLFSAPAFAPLVPMGTLALLPYLRDWKLKYPVMLMSAFPIFFSAGRGTFLGLVIGLVVCGATSAKRMISILGGTVLIASLMMLLGPYLPGQAGRAESLDPIVNVARVISTWDPDASYKLLMSRGYVHEAENVRIAEGTAKWRKAIWTNAIKSLDCTRLLLLGQGHGASVADLTPDKQELHTPHNFIIYAIYYTGAIGLAVFGFMILAVLATGWHLTDPTLRTFLLATVLMFVMLAAVGNMFETPAAAIPFYLLCGMTIGMDWRGEGAVA